VDSKEVCKKNTLPKMAHGNAKKFHDIEPKSMRRPYKMSRLIVLAMTSSFLECRNGLLKE